MSRRSAAFLGGLLSVLWCCGKGGTGNPTDGGPDADNDADGDTDSDMDSDADADWLHDAVESLVAPLVDPTGSDVTRAVGLVVVLVSRNHTDVLGFGAVRAGAAATPDGTTAFQFGSVSKVLTGLILASLVETAGNGVAAADPVNDHLAADVSAPDFDGNQITLEHLVSHYSSLPNMPDNLTGPRWSPAWDYSREQLAEFLAGHTLVRAPGTLYEYSNVGVGLLGVALTDATGAPDFGSLLEERLTAQLGMTATGTREPAFLDALGDRLAQGYAQQGVVLVEVGVSDMGVLAGAGEVLSTGDDVARLLRVLTGIEAFPVDGAVDRALTAVGPGAPDEEIGYAFDIVPRPGGVEQYEKGGITAGYSAYLAFRRDPAVGAAILSNRGRHVGLQAVARDVVDLLVDHE